jgi:crotonobetainyl-CoA:carnitine CoA-transferase CaiB-like acyl-CoA transferase
MSLPAAPAETRDLAGVLVVAIEQAVAAPYASRRLADAGARVIKIERPEGDFARRYDRLVHGQSAYFVWLNGGKESVCLDLRSPADRELLDGLIARADVFLHNLKPGALDSLGFESAVRNGRHPRLIDCEISGFGPGPLAHLKAYDLIVQGESGLCEITGTGEYPARVGVSVCDIAAGLAAHGAILQALYARERTGRGRRIEVSLFGSIADWMNVPLLQYLYGDTIPARAGVNHATIAPYGAYACGDGIRVIFSVQNDREWRAFCAHVLEDAALAVRDEFRDNPARVQNRAALDAVVVATFERAPARAVMARLEAAGIAYGRLNGVEAAAAHPHLRLVSIDTPAGEVRIVAPAPAGEVTDWVGRVPALGEHTQGVREEFARYGVNATTA